MKFYKQNLSEMIYELKLQHLNAPHQVSSLKINPYKFYKNLPGLELGLPGGLLGSPKLLPRIPSGEDGFYGVIRNIDPHQLCIN